MKLLDEMRTERPSTRVRRLLRSGMELTVARLVSMTMSLVMLPIAVASMSDETFGLWMTMASISAVLGLFNLGVGNAMVSMVAGALDDERRRHRIVSTGFVLAGIGGALCCVLFGLFIAGGDWVTTFSLTTISNRQAQTVLAICLVLFSLTLPLGVVLNVRQGQERHDVVAFLTVLGSLVALGLVLLGAQVASWQLIVISQFAGTFVATLIGWGSARLRPRIAIPRWRAVDRSLAPGILRTGSHYLGLQLAAVVAFSSDNIVAAKLFGAAAVGDYAVPSRVASAFLALLALPAAPLWSSIARSLSDGSVGWIRRAIERLRLWLPVLAVGVFAAFAVVVGPVSAALSNGAHRPDWILRLWLAAFVAVGTVGNWIAPVLNGLSMTRMQVTHSLMMAAVNVVLSVLLARRFGIVGLAAGSAISYLGFLAGPYYLRLRSLADFYSGRGGT